MIFIGGYITGMFVAFLAVMFFSGIKQADADLGVQAHPLEPARVAAQPAPARRKLATAPRRKQAVV
ncbi:hypothetical protein AAG565_06765 [Fontimonas sp. SYSU GA230001]|uniref:hypothetical protein n=1 Tax=Fontimonas sp. SYSU GA230001 TaxID=3142450 RepID=UPI0032B4800B